MTIHNYSLSCVIMYLQFSAYGVYNVSFSKKNYDNINNNNFLADDTRILLRSLALYTHTHNCFK